jgi:acyl-CoA hydrolase
MEIGIKVVAENIRTQESRHVNSCFFTMVAVDDNRAPVQVPQLHPSTAAEERRYTEAKARKQLRLELDQVGTPR